jgi:hypothetical protein
LAWDLARHKLRLVHFDLAAQEADDPFMVRESSTA